MSFTAERYHDISCGHRVYGHESKCAHLHGHNYRIHFICEPATFNDTKDQLFTELDKVGRVIDFSVIKEKLCMWVECIWDHKFLIWREDHLAEALLQMDLDGVVLVLFNPTAENMARFLVEEIGPRELRGTGVVLRKVIVEETAKCSASYTLEDEDERKPQEGE